MKNKIKVCPKCKSKDIIISMNALTTEAFPAKYKCEDCGFESYIIAEKIKKVKIK
ncbi:MAG: hypothetical protein AABW67_03005 [Nanoarchaeota archaeon]